LGTEGDEAAFRQFVPLAEPRLRRALVAAYGPDRGLEAAAEALAYAWEHWGKVQSLSNPVGYLYRVGQSRTRPSMTRRLFHRPETQEHWVEPQLGTALLELSERQRVAVVLVFAAGLTPQEAADVLGVSASTVKTNTERGVAKLRRSLGVVLDD
jgi:RNA polymerase sigma factor (sigma-70 family)